MNKTTSQQMVERYLEAELAVLDGKTVTLAGRTLGMENLAEIRKGRQEWEARVASERGGSTGRAHSLASFG
ncbi:hypothetical protein [Pseudomonas oryzihabitans]|uniref:hypothetical protein n=1 Tax=Pseudomonas oryzihabitans TaxID=47885 RepID=UPI00119D3710|nr:hypothetical protein [Pseudomonas oryzihabitans]